MGVVESLRAYAEPVWEKIFDHPFVVELYSGSLPLEKFKYFVLQDYNYLVTMTKCYSIMAAKAEDFEVARRVLEIAHLDATAELESYEKLLAELGLTLRDALAAEVAPTNLAYSNFLLATCSLGTTLEGLASTLPCFWTYAEVAKRHEGRLHYNKVRLYVSWARVYLSEGYLKIVEMLKELVNSLSAGSDVSKIKQLFLTASKYEYMFWDMAYRMERWPI